MSNPSSRQEPEHAMEKERGLCHCDSPVRDGAQCRSCNRWWSLEAMEQELTRLQLLDAVDPQGGLKESRPRATNLPVGEARQGGEQEGNG